MSKKKNRNDLIGNENWDFIIELFVLVSFFKKGECSFTVHIIEKKGEW